MKMKLFFCPHFSDKVPQLKGNHEHYLSSLSEPGAGVSAWSYKINVDGAHSFFMPPIVTATVNET
jgi:hypothetical protein